MVTDVDNTLFDWLNYWYRSFSPFLGELSRLSKLPVAQLVPKVRSVFRRHRTTEYVFLIEEIPELVEAAAPTDPLDYYAPAIQAFRAGGDASLRLYPTVLDTLLELRRRHVQLVAYTDSPAFQARTRCLALGLDGVIDRLFSQDDRVPPGVVLKRSRAPGAYDLQHTIHHSDSLGATKPQPRALRAVLTAVGATVASAIYVGDSLSQDVSMAQRAGVFSVYARYGDVQNGPAYRLLRQLSHRPPVPSHQPRPDFVLVRTFAEILQLPTLQAIHPSHSGDH